MHLAVATAPCLPADQSSPGITPDPHTAVYTWASSRPGDERFAEAYRKLGVHDKTLRCVKRCMAGGVAASHP